MCALILLTCFVCNISHSKQNCAKFCHKFHNCSCKVPAVVVRFQFKLNFIDLFSKYAQITTFMKILPVGSELFRADGRTSRHGEANSRFLKFCDAPKTFRGICLNSPISAFGIIFSVPFIILHITEMSEAWSIDLQS